MMTAQKRKILRHKILVPSRLNNKMMKNNSNKMKMIKSNLDKNKNKMKTSLPHNYKK